MADRNTDRLGVALVVSAPSGAGKSTIIQRVRELDGNLSFSVSCTTRAPRPGEEEGVHYYFLDRAEFEKRVAAGEFLEHAEFSGNCYGTLISEVEDRLKRGEDVVLEIEVQGAAQIREAAAKGGLLQKCVFFLFIAPPSMEILEKRLRERGTETEEAIHTRLAAAGDELAEQDKYDAVVISTNPEEASEHFLRELNQKRAELVGL